MLLKFLIDETSNYILGNSKKILERAREYCRMKPTKTEWCRTSEFPSKYRMNVKEQPLIQTGRVIKMSSIIKNEESRVEVWNLIETMNWKFQ